MRIELVLTLSFVAVLAYVIWIKSKSVRSDSRVQSEDLRQKSARAENLSPSASQWSKLFDGFLSFLVITLILGLAVVGIYWGCSKVNDSRPERRESSGYYHCHRVMWDLTTPTTGQVMVHTTPDEVRFSYANDIGGQVSGRWTRGGGGTYTVQGNSFYSSTFKVTNVTGNKLADFEAWQTLITIEIDDDSEHRGLGKMDLSR